MSNIPSEVLNELFVSKLDTEAGKEKIAALGGDYIRDRLREESFARKVLPPTSVSRSDLQVSVAHDTLVKIVEIEPQSRAMSMTFRGQPEVSYYTGSRFEVPFHTVGSLRYEQTEQELMAYTMPITEIIRKNIVNDIQEIEDTVFLTHMEKAVVSLNQDELGNAFDAQLEDADAFCGNAIDGGTAATRGKVKGTGVTLAGEGVDSVESASLDKLDLINLFQLFTGSGEKGSRLRCDQILMTDTDFEDINGWTQDEVGHKIVGESVVDGWKYNTLFGRKFIRTLKTDILRPGNIYAFAAPEFLGGFLVLNKTKFYADKERNRVSFEAWEDIGMYVGNVAGVRKLELYSGDAGNTSTSNANCKAKFAPKAESELGAKNNLVEEGGTVPNVDQF
tara:strand:- start:4995 stop:6167 length:1173 start_codon:yes stop_codon:yes gene_type:complete